jgi:hypothetical protein
MRHHVFTATALLVCIANPAHSETIRCGSWLVDASVSVEELVRKCGEPASRRAEVQDIRVRSPNDSSTRIVGTTVTEYWTYDRGTQAAPVLVTIIDGKIRSIERIR